MPDAASLPAALGRSFEAVLLDMDGTLVDSTPSVERSWLRWCTEHGVDPRRLAGSHGVTARNLIADLLPPAQHESAYARIVELEVGDVAGTQLLPGALELLGALRDAGVPTAIVTSSNRELARARLEVTRLPRPSVVVTADDVARGKPFPDPWLLGATRLGVASADCLVIEDAVAGLRAARAAGCGGLVAVPTTTSAEQLEAVADLVVGGLTELRLDLGDGRARVLPGPGRPGPAPRGPVSA
ncbi:HAD-IA family hydrolase [Phycicoccus endophyticus]|uniref:HAD-IA family hydrolase n=1 Tax=Phycicoccus endophyticus TaxID=1690220 RepID=A0A7G9R0D1_9MICO|nr:HAD-IA family hydrolase [Phycicoccus endophyticus]NHI20131.1 HAD-IA family hydrolase [Phycicoccus endophyticus]QNN49056.1 HAD-IA family hydrolase [Phycicoccus endophyticus]GGL38140.1 phosphatase [Phycicoccus endophyticus]